MRLILDGFGLAFVVFFSSFHTDVVIDLIGYRKHGHNEIDEPMFTQPIMYSVVRKHKDVMQLYSKKLQDEGEYCQ